MTEDEMGSSSLLDSQTYFPRNPENMDVADL